MVDCVFHKAGTIWSLSPSVGRRHNAVHALHEEALERPTQRGISAFRSDNDRIKEQE